MTDYTELWYVGYAGKYIGRYHADECGRILWAEDMQDFDKATVRCIPDETTAMQVAEELKRDPKAYRW